jgi:hypothetical protein
MKKFSCFLFLTLLFSGVLPLKAAVPDIGDNSFFECIETEDDFEPGMCFGDISWVTDKNGVDRGGQIVTLKRARRILSKATKFFKKQRNKASRQEDIELFDEFEAKRLNAIQSKKDLKACYRDFYDVCGSDSDDDGDEAGDNSSGDFPSLTEACNLIYDPTNYGEIPRQRSRKFIVNGKVCSGNAAATSPVLRIMLNNNQHCTGTYVAANTILTAAHCLEDVNCGDLEVENSTGSQIIGVTECIMHPGYNNASEPQANDVAIIELPNDFDGITPVKVATTNAQVGDDSAFAGFGRSESNDQKLRATFNKISDVSTSVISTFYTRGETNEGTTCSGDSGGALFTFSDGEWKTHGTLSDGSATNCALPGTNPKSDKSNWANLVDPNVQSFIRDNTEGVLD